MDLTFGESERSEIFSSVVEDLTRALKDEKGDLIDYIVGLLDGHLLEFFEDDPALYEVGFRLEVYKSTHEVKYFRSDRWLNSEAFNDGRRTGAVVTGNVALLKQLLPKPIDWHSIDWERNYAVPIQKRGALGYYTKWESNPLAYGDAITNGAMVEFMMQNGYNPTGKGLLALAAKDDSSGSFYYLLDSGFEFHKGELESAAEQAALYGSTKFLERLIEKGVRGSDYYDEAVVGGFDSMIALLKSKYPNVTLDAEKSKKLFIYAIRRSDGGAVSRLINAGVSPNEEWHTRANVPGLPKSRVTIRPMTEALKGGNDGVIRTLIDAGGIIEKKDVEDWVGDYNVPLDKFTSLESKSKWPLYADHMTEDAKAYLVSKMKKAFPRRKAALKYFQ